MGVLENSIDKDTKVRIFDMADDRRIELDLTDIEMIFKGYRPRKINAEDFRYICKIIRKEVRDHLKYGTLFHLSKVSDALWREYYEKGTVKHYRQRGYTYKKKEHEKK